MSGATIVPSRAEEWVFYAESEGRQEQVWSTVHFEFDFIKGGDEPFHVLATHLEPAAFIAVYKEHGATSVAIAKKGEQAAQGASSWYTVGDEHLAEDYDDEGDCEPVVGSEIFGNIRDKSMHIRLKTVQGKSGMDFVLTWSKAVPVWTRVK